MATGVLLSVQPISQPYGSPLGQDGVCATVPTSDPGDPFLELLAETLSNLDREPRGQFLQRFFKAIAQLDLTDAVSIEFWDQILDRRRDLSENLGRSIALKTAMVDVLASSSYLRLP